MNRSLNSKTLLSAFIGLPLILLFFVGLLLFLESLPSKWFYLILIALVFGLFVLMTKNLKLCLLFVLVISIPLNLDVLLMSRNQTGFINGIFLSLTDISILGLILLWASGSLANSEKEDLKIHFYPQFTHPALLYLIACILSLLVTSDKTWTVFGIVHQIKLLLLFFVVANSVKTKREITYVIWFLAISLFIQSAVYLIQHYTHTDFDILGASHLTKESYSVTRERGFMGQANTSGNFFASCLPLTLALYLLQPKTFTKLILGIVMALAISALIITLTRVAWLALLLSGLVFAVIGMRRKWLRLKTVFIPLILIAAVISIFWGSVHYRLTADDGGSAESRIPSAILMMRIIKDHPVLGIGANNYLGVRADYLGPDVIGALRHPHNQYLLVWVETGTIGLLGFLWFLYASFREATSIIKSEDHSQCILITGLLMSLFAICLSMMTNHAAYGSVAMLMWFLAGLIAATGRIYRESSSLVTKSRDE